MKVKSKAGRKPLGEKPMTALEQKRRHRAIKKQWLEEHNKVQCKPVPIDADLYREAIGVSRTSGIDEQEALIYAIESGLRSIIDNIRGEYEQ